jgi:hypothetical protein
MSVAAGFCVAAAAAQPMSPDRFCESDFPRYYAALNNDGWSDREGIEIWLSEMPDPRSELAGEPLLQAEAVFKVEDREEIGIAERRSLNYRKVVDERVVSMFARALDAWRREVELDRPKMVCSHCASITVWTCTDGELSEQTANGASADFASFQTLIHAYLEGLESAFPKQLEWRDDVLERSRRRAEEAEARWESLPDRFETVPDRD